MEPKNPLREWRQTKGLTIKALSDRCGLTTEELHRVEAGHFGLPGELQDYLTSQGVNVSQMASDQSAFIVASRA